MSRSHQQSDELFLPASSHPRRESFFDAPASPTFLYDEESGTFKTVWPSPSIQPQSKEDAVQETYWGDVRPPSPLRTPPRNQYYQPPISKSNQTTQELGNHENQRYQQQNEVVAPRRDVSGQQHLSVVSPMAATVHLRSEHETGRALPPPNKQRVALYDNKVEDYNGFEREVDADAVSEASFSDHSPRDDRTYLPSSRDPVTAPRLDTSKAKLWATPRRDVGIEAPIVVHPEPSKPEYYQAQESSFQREPDTHYQRPVISTDPRLGHERVQSNTVYQRTLEPQPQYRHQQRPRIASEPGYQERNSQQVYQRDYEQQQQQRPRIASEPGYQERNSQQVYQRNYEQQQQQQQQHQQQQQQQQRRTQQQRTQQEQQQQQRPRILSDPGAGSHWERRRDLAIGRSSMPPIGAFDENPTSSFKVLNVQRVPVGSLDQQMPQPTKDDGKKLKMWKKIKGYVS